MSGILKFYMLKTSGLLVFYSILINHFFNKYYLKSQYKSKENDKHEEINE
jgi:hypothetical protein